MRPSSKLRGQAMVEYLIVFPALVILVLGAVQFALLYQIKSTLNYAVFMGARQGAVKNASMKSIKDGMASGMTPLFTFDPSVNGVLRGRVIAMLEVFNPMTTTVEMISPTPGSFKDFDPSNEKEIPNDNLAYRCQSADPDDCVGSNGHLNIMDANVLKIKVTYCAKMVVPVVNSTIYALVNGIQGTKNLTTEYFFTAPKVATTPNSCSQLKDRFGEKVAAIAGLGSYVGVDLSPLNSMLTDVSNAVAGITVPGVDWEIGGYRIPITAEAVVRMQSPAQK